jgi:hypothetical protein
MQNDFPQPATFTQSKQSNGAWVAVVVTKQEANGSKSQVLIIEPIQPIIK